MQKKNTTNTKWIQIQQILIYILIIVIWQLIYWFGTEIIKCWKPYAMPNPKGVFETFIRLSSNGTLLSASLYSFARAVIGFIISIIIGLIIGGIISSIDILNKSLKPLILGIQSLPSVCWVPFAILWFGLKDKAILFVVIMGSAFSIAIAVEHGIRGVNPIYIKAAKTMGAKTKDLLLKVVFPASIPALISGLKQGWSFAWRALMSAEVMSASIGLGYTLMLGRDLADINQVMLVMIIIILIGILVDKLVFSSLEKRVLKKRGL